MDKRETLSRLIEMRMKAKAEIEKFRFLSTYTKVSYDNRINELLDLINSIDKAIEELRK